MIDLDYAAIVINNFALGSLIPLFKIMKRLQSLILPWVLESQLKASCKGEKPMLQGLLVLGFQKQNVWYKFSHLLLLFISPSFLEFKMGKTGFKNVYNFANGCQRENLDQAQERQRDKRRFDSLSKTILISEPLYLKNTPIQQNPFFWRNNLRDCEFFCTALQSKV